MHWQLGTIARMFAPDDDRSSDDARIVGEMGVPLAVTVWSFVILAIIIAVPAWLVFKVTNRTGRNSAEIDEHDDGPH